MKKLAGLIFIVFLLLLGAFGTPKVFAVDCNFAFDGGLKFCYGGFSSKQALLDSTIQFQCTGGPLSCGVGYIPPQSMRVGDLPGVAGGYDPNKGWWNCTSVTIGQETINAIHNRPIPYSVFQGSVNGGGANCSSTQSVQVKSDGSVSAWIGSNSISAGTQLQAGTGLQFCGANNSGIKTALGCVPTDPSAFIGFILTIGIGLAGGIAFLLILWGGFQILTSAGNPEQLNAGKELVSSAIAGLLLIIFSVFILRLIGVNILGIPGFI